MTKTGTLALWLVAFSALFLTLAPVLAFLDSAFLPFTQIGF